MSKVRGIPKLRASGPVALAALRQLLEEWQRDMEGWPYVDGNLLLAAYDFCVAFGLPPSQIEALLGDADHRALVLMLGDLEDDSPPWDE